MREGSSFYPVSVSTGHVAMRIRVQDWTRILMGPVITDHWTEAQPMREWFHEMSHLRVESLVNFLYLRGG